MVTYDTDKPNRIYKSKYNEDGKPSSKAEKKDRSKSRTRNIFGIKHNS